MGDFTPTDAIALQRDGYGNDMWGGNGAWWLLILFALFAGGGNWGRNNDLQGALTRGDLCDGFNFNDLKRQVQGNANGICDLGYASLNQTNQLGMQIAENRFAQQQCCCETNRNIDAVHAENYRNTCDITTAIHAEGEATRALINQNTMQELRDRLAQRDRDIMTANFQLSQQAQTANIIDTLQPVSRPAYLTCSPYQSAQFPFGFNGCGHNFGGCGCGC